MDIEEMVRQWTSKMFGQWTLKNILNIDDTHTRISTTDPDYRLVQNSQSNSVLKFLFLSATADVQTLGQDTWPPTTTQFNGNE